MSAKNITNPYEYMIRLLDEIEKKLDSLTVQGKQTSKSLLTPKDLEAEYGYKVSSQGNLRSSGRLPYRKEGRKIFYEREKIEKHILSNSEKF